MPQFLCCITAEQQISVLKPIELQNKKVVLLAIPYELQLHHGWDTAQKILWHGQAVSYHLSGAGTESQYWCAQTSRDWKSKQTVSSRVLYALLLHRNDHTGYVCIEHDLTSVWIYVTAIVSELHWQLGISSTALGTSATKITPSWNARIKMAPLM